MTAILKGLWAKKTPKLPREKLSKVIAKDFRRNWPLYVLVMPVIVWYIVFQYIPMYGVQIAFRDFRITLGFLRSPWVGLDHFRRFFGGFFAWRLIRNTFLLNFYGLLWGFPAPIIFALLLNELRNERFKKIVQNFSYLPHFISMVVIASMIHMFAASGGLFNSIGAFFGHTPTPLLRHVQYYRTIFIASGIWQSLGWSSIIYMAAISGVDQELYEVATVDGAGRFRKMWHITLPGIRPTIIILFIMNIGSIMSMGPERTLLLYNPAVYEVADILSTYIFRMGLERGDFGFGAAVGLLNSGINLILLISANFISKRLSGTSLW